MIRGKSIRWIGQEPSLSRKEKTFSERTVDEEETIMNEKQDALDRLMTAELSRRNFLKMSAFAGIAASVGGVVTLDLD